jgi:proteic killer suppression protein
LLRKKGRFGDLYSVRTELLPFNASRYTIEFVIKSFRDDETEKIYNLRRSRRLPADIQQVALRKLRMLNNAQNLIDLGIPPANHLEKLAGKRAGRYSIRINDQWRICFGWKENAAFDVEIVDYH